MGLQSTQGYRGKLVDKLTGTILDQYSDEDIKISNNILDLFDLGEIPGTYTQQITLPGTKKNNAFFEQYYDISVWEPDLFNTNQVVEAYLDFDGFYLVNGYLQLNKVNVLENKFVDSYDVTLFGIVSNFSIDTRAAFLTDLLSLSAYNHTSSYANITSSWANGLFNGDIVYPMAEYGSPQGPGIPTFYYSGVDFLGIDDAEGAVCVQDYKPAIRVKKVWDAIFNEFGYTYTGSFWNESWLNNVYLFLNNNQRTSIYPDSIETYLQANLINISASATTLTANVSQSFPVNGKEYDYNNAYTLSGTSFTFSNPITTKLEAAINLAFKVTHTGGAGSGIPVWYIDYVNVSTGTTVNTQVLARLNTQLSTIRDSRATTVTEIFNIKDYLFTVPELDPGDYNFKIYYVVYGTNNFTVQLNPDGDNQSSLRIRKAKQAADGKIISIPQNMPFGTSGIRVIDFIRGIQKKFNLIIYPDKQNPNQFIVETFNNWYKQGEIKDFNKYINVKDKIEFIPANQLAYRQVKFTDEKDQDYISTLFGRQYNRIYGESNFYDTGSFYSQNTLDVTANELAAGPLGLVPGSGYSGSAANQTCTTYTLINRSDRGDDSSDVTYSYTTCGGSSSGTRTLLAGRSVTFCALSGFYEVTGNYEWEIYEEGDCSPGGTSTVSGSQFPVYIPYYISDANYTPARVLPRLMFYNGLVNAPKYYLEGYPLPSTSSIGQISLEQYPYFDNYSTGSLNGTSSIYPELNARSLLFNNEQAVVGTTPSSSLVSEYWDKYLSLLYNPRTRLVNASAVIGLADYFDLELNDIAEFRGNYYHLRAINDYNLTTGECNIQLLGPIISDTISSILSGSWTPAENPCTFNFTASLNNPSFGFAGVSQSLATEFGTVSQIQGPLGLLVDGDSIYSYGKFYCYNGNTAWDLVKTNNAGTYDSTFNTIIGPSGSTVQPAGPARYFATELAVQSPVITAIAKQAITDKLIVAGVFNSWSGSAIPISGSIITGSWSSTIRLNSDATRDTSFTALDLAYDDTPPQYRSNDIPCSIAPFANGSLAMGTVGGTAYIINTTGSLVATSSYSGINGYAKVDILGPDTVGSPGKVIHFNTNTTFALNDRQTSVRVFNYNGTAYNTFFTYGPSTGSSILTGGMVASDNKVYVIGKFNGFGGTGLTNQRNTKGIAKLLSTGADDTTFNFSATGSGYITGSAIFEQSDGKVLYAVVGSTGQSKLYRLTNSGSVDLEFNLETGSFASASISPTGFSLGNIGRFITSVSQLSNGNVMAVGGAYTELSGSIVKGWAQIYDSTTGDRLDYTSNLC